MDGIEAASSPKLRALEDTPAAQAKAANLFQVNLEACREERAMVKDVGAAWGRDIISECNSFL